MKAVDLYSGIGGWTLGLKMAKVEVAASFEWWDEANATYNNNFNANNKDVDIRKLDYKLLPEPGTVDFVVGSPPCTQFSFANRGGNGNIDDGLIDIVKFLEIVQYLKPSYWVMENIPRVARIIEHEIQPGGRLHKFAHLLPDVLVSSIAEYGLPQSRMRMFAGSFPAKLFDSYKGLSAPLALGEVMESFKKRRVLDPIYKFYLPRHELTDYEIEPALDDEETRLNREAKSYHPVYNIMNFPDLLDKPSRTITATCTRVSRESIIVQNGVGLRRLTIRERASLQSFPVTFQFYGRSYTSRLKMVGNALPPLIAYYLACAMRGIPREKVVPIGLLKYKHSLPDTLPESVNVAVGTRSYPAKRSFRSAVQGLRFGSGVRFDLSNEFCGDGVTWRIAFSHGQSKNYSTVNLNDRILEESLALVTENTKQGIIAILDRSFPKKFIKLTGFGLQQSWIHKASGVSPFNVSDIVSEVAQKVMEKLTQEDLLLIANNISTVFAMHGEELSPRTIKKYSREIFAGAVVGSWFNITFTPLSGEGAVVR
jgi:DNA (cytosine-5)-methyltransferase 1